MWNKFLIHGFIVKKKFFLSWILFLVCSDTTRTNIICLISLYASKPQMRTPIDWFSNDCNLPHTNIEQKKIKLFEHTRIHSNVFGQYVYIKSSNQRNIVKRGSYMRCKLMNNQLNAILLPNHDKWVLKSFNYILTYSCPTENTSMQHLKSYMRSMQFHWSHPFRQISCFLFSIFRFLFCVSLDRVRCTSCVIQYFRKIRTRFTKPNPFYK